MILVIRHAQKGPDGNITEGGEIAATKFGTRIHERGYTRALTAPNARSIQTAEAAGLKIIGECPELGIPVDYEGYMNGPVVERMLAQPGMSWEQSFTRAVIEDPLYKDVFGTWGAKLANIIRLRSSAQRSQARFDDNTMDMFKNDQAILRIPDQLVLIGSSPLIELGYLALSGSSNWHDFPRCRELEGFTLCGTQLALFK